MMTNARESGLINVRLTLFDCFGDKGSTFPLDAIRRYTDFLSLFRTACNEDKH